MLKPVVVLQLLWSTLNIVSPEPQCAVQSIDVDGALADPLETPGANTARFCSKFLEQSWTRGAQHRPWRECFSDSRMSEFTGNPFAFSELVPRFKTCALVGSSGTLLRSSNNLGGEIDEHELVARLNMAPDSSFTHPVYGVFRPEQSQVGARSDLRIGNSMDSAKLCSLHPPNKSEPSGFMYFRGWQSGFGSQRSRPQISVCANWATYWNQTFEALNLPGHHIAPPCLEVSMHYLLYMARLINEAAGIPEALQKLDRQPNGAPSSGFVAVMGMLQLCDQLDLYGFRMCDSRLDSVPKRREFLQVNTSDAASFHGAASKHVIVEEQHESKYFCSYYPVTKEKISQDKRDSQGGPAFHYFAAEHAPIHRMEECGLLRQRD